MTLENSTLDKQKRTAETFLFDLKVALTELLKDPLLNALREKIDLAIDQIDEVIARTTREGRVYSPRHFVQRVSEIAYDVKALFSRTLKMSGASARLVEDISLILKNLEEITSDNTESELEQAYAKREIETNPIYRLIIKEINSSNKSVRNEYSRLINSIENIQSEIESSVADAKSETEQIEAEAREILKTLKVNAEQAKVTVGLIGATAVSSAHRDRAEEERKIASRLRIGVLTSLGFSAGIILLSIFDCLPPVVDWQDLLLRYGAVVFFTIPAAYMAKESTRHREMQRKYESFHINFAAVNNFFSDMEKEARNQLQTELAKHLLISKESLSDTTSDIELTGHQQKIIELLTKLIDKKIGS
ncbi:hypothetical protein [Rheinheimera aquimaris]|uniref:hypothetical protein n=1 Tax=Rheinheimera aquimaris TaxID=412437 RepID=UPI003A96CB05